MSEHTSPSIKNAGTGSKLTVVQKLNLLREQYVRLHNHCTKMKAELDRLRASQSTASSLHSSAAASPVLASPALSPDSSPAPSTPTSPRGSYHEANGGIRGVATSISAPSLFNAPNQASEKSEFVAEIMSYVQGLYDSEEMSDIVFQVEDQTLYGHSVVVAARSSYFKRLIQENSNQRPISIKIDDVKISIFKELLRYMYTDVIKVNNQDIVKDLLVVGAKFQLHKLKSVLEKELIRIITPQNCVSLLNVAVASNTPELKEVCLKTIQQSFEQIKEQSKSFEELDTKLVREINQRQSKYPLHFSLRLRRGDVVISYLKDINNGASQVDVNQRDDQGCSILRVALLYDDFKVASALIENGADTNVIADDKGEEKKAKPKREGVSNNLLLHRFIEEDNEDAAIFLINNKADINRSNSLRETPLHLAALFGLTKVVTLLLDNSALVNNQDIKQRTALHDCIISKSSHNEDVVRILLNSRRCPNLEIKDEDGLTALGLSLKEKCYSIAELLVQHEANVNATTLQEGETLLHYSINSGDEKSALFLLAHNVDLNRADQQNNTPLHLAVMKNSAVIVKSLLKKGALINAQGHQAQTPIHIAVTNNNESMTELLLDHSQNENRVDLSLCDDIGFTPLRHALRRRSEKIAHILVEKGHADVDAIDKEGASLLDSSLEENNDWAGLFLISNNVNINNSGSNSTRMPLEIAIERGLVNTMKALLSRGVDVNGAGSANRTPLYQALRKRDYEMCFLLIERGADINGNELLHTLIREDDDPSVKFLLNNNADVNRLDSEQKTPLHLVCLLGKDKMVRVLLELGSEINAVDCNGQTALHLAVQQGHLKVIEALLPYSPSLKIRDVNHRTPLGEALLQKRDPVAMLLIEKGGADANEVDETGKTLLHQAIEDGNEEDVLFLITMKISLEGRRMSDYSTPLHMAVSGHQSIIVTVLLFNQADVNAVDGSGMTPLNIAARKGYLDIIDMILEQRMDVNVNLPDMDGNTPLHNAILENQPAAAKKLLRHKSINANARSYIGRTPLHLLAEGGGDPLLVSNLIQRGAEVDTLDATNNTPLHLAAFTCHDEIAVELAKNGAQISMPNRNGHTCLDNLFSQDDYEMTAFVKELQRRLIEAIPREPKFLPDDLTETCQICRRDFNFAYRKHHCRHCGRIICSSCSPKEVIIDKFTDESPRRVCTTCYDILTTPKAQSLVAPNRW